MIFLERDEKGSWARGCPGTRNTSKGKTQQKNCEDYARHCKDERTSTKPHCCPDTLPSIYKGLRLSQEHSKELIPFLPMP